jgi:hypothetical protein
MGQDMEEHDGDGRTVIEAVLKTEIIHLRSDVALLRLEIVDICRDIRSLEAKDTNRRVEAARLGVTIGIVTAVITALLSGVAVALVMRGFGG